MDENNTTITTSASEAKQLDASYVVAKIEQIMAESEHLRKALEILNSRCLDGGAIIGIGNMIEARERTNREMISLLKSIIDKL